MSVEKNYSVKYSFYRFYFLILFLLTSLHFSSLQGYQQVSFPTDKIVKEGTTFQLECTFSSLPNLLTWVFNGTHPIPDSNSSTLSIIASADTAGYYHCEASYELGLVVSIPALIQIGYIQALVDTPVAVLGSPGSWLLLSCEHVVSLPQAVILWLEQDVVEQIVSGSNQKTLLNGSLLFSNLTSADEGLYICQANNPSIQEFRRVSYNLSLATLTGTVAESSQLHFITPSSNTIATGEDAVFQCIVDSSDSALSWGYDGSLLTTTANYLFRDNGATLIVLSAASSQSGEYSCAIDSTTSVSVSLTVLDTPVVSVDSSSAVEVGLSGNFVLSCAIEQGSYPLQWHWFKNGVPVSSASWKEGELAVGSSEETDEGIYQCIASNQVGRDTRTFTVRVISYSPQFLTSQPFSSITQFIGSPLSINCSADSVPSPQYSWSRDNVPLDSIAQGIVGPGILIKSSLTEEDSGNYTCTVSNSVGSIQRSIYVRVRDGFSITREPSSQTFSLGNNNYLVCEASVDSRLSLSFTWLLNGAPLQTSNRVDYIEPQRGTLLFQDTQPSDMGEYQCLVEAIGEVADTHIFNSSLATRKVLVQVLKVPPAPYELSSSEVNVDSLFLSWTRTSSPTPSSYFYIFISIKYSNGTISSVDSFDVNNTSTQLTQLLPYTLYFIQVSGGTEVGVGPRSEPPLLTRTLPAVPTVGPAGLTLLQIDTDSIQFEWNQPPERLPDGRGRNGEIIQYEISLRSQRNSMQKLYSSLLTSYQLTGLLPYTLYNVSVAAIGNLGKSPFSPSLIVKTLAAEPRLGPAGLDCRAASATSIACRVVLPNPLDRNGYIDGYEVSYREDTSDDWYRVTLGNNALLSFKGDVREFLLLELSSNTIYYLNVSLFNAVINANRVSPFISIGPVSTNNSVPGPPTELRLFSSTHSSITANWSLPSRLDGDVISYFVTLLLLPVYRLRSLSLNSSITSYTFHSLDANAEYSISVYAESSNGISFEKESRFTLHPGPPSPPTLNIYSIGSTVFLQWVPGANGGSPILEYRLEYSFTRADWFKLDSLNSSAIRYQTGSLPAGKLLLRLFAVSRLGETTSNEVSVEILNKSLLNELSVQVGIGAAVLLLILLVIALAGISCILYIRRRSRIKYDLRSNNTYVVQSKVNRRANSDFSIDFPENFNSQYLTEDNIVGGAPPDFRSFEVGDYEQYTPPLNMNILHFSPSISSLQRPCDHWSQFPIWSKPPPSESSTQDPAHTTESKGYVPMNALYLGVNREPNHSEIHTITPGITPRNLLQDMITPGQPLSIDNSEWSLSNAETDPRCQTIV